MKIFTHYTLGLLLALLVFVGCSDRGSGLDQQAPYCDLKPPGTSAELFDPGFFPEGESQGCSGFLADGTVFIFTSNQKGSDWRLRPTYVTELKNGKWTAPRIAPFSHYGPYNFTVGPDGQTVYFTTLKSPDKTTSMLLEEANIWMVQLQMDGWTEPVMLGRSINTPDHYENYPAVTSNGTIYYMGHREDRIGRTDVYRSRNDDGRYAEAENVGRPVNTEESDADPFVAPDESYLIVCQKKDEGFGEYDLYISYSRQDGSWTVPINMGEGVNSSAFEFRPYVTPDGKYLFFTSNRASGDTGKIYWVDAGVIATLKPDELR